METKILELDHRLTNTEADVKVIDKDLTITKETVKTIITNQATQGADVATIKEDIHSIYLTIANGKGWVIGILGAGALANTVINWIVKFTQ